MFKFIFFLDLMFRGAPIFFCAQGLNQPKSALGRGWKKKGKIRGAKHDWLEMIFPLIFEKNLLTKRASFEGGIFSLLMQRTYDYVTRCLFKSVIYNLQAALLLLLIWSCILVNMWILLYLLLYFDFL